MARALSHLMSKIRGSVGGLTYSANQYYQIIMKNRTTPVQPNTTAQQLARNALTAAQETWNGLTTAVRAAWDLYANNLSWPDPLGTHKIPGRQVFMAGRAMQNYIFEAGLAVPTFVTTAPPSFLGFYLPQSINIAALAAPGTGFAVSLSSEFAFDGTFLVEISGPWPDTRNRYKGPWQVADSQVAIVPANTSVLVPFEVGSDDDIYFVRVKAVADDASPRVSAQTILRAVVTTTSV